jgi:hypothetical protein
LTIITNKATISPIIRAEEFLMSLFQSQKQKMEMKLSAELSFKIMQVGQLVFELKTDYIQFFDEDTRIKLLQVNEIIDELAQQMTGSTAERMYLWRVEKEEKKRLTQQEANLEKKDESSRESPQTPPEEQK